MNPRLTVGLRLLLDAADYARDAGKPPEHFAVELADLMAAGVLHIDVQWLLAKGHLKQISEESRGPASDGAAKTDPLAHLPARSRFVLTSSGIQLARQLGDGEPIVAEPVSSRKGRTLRVDPPASRRQTPRWNPATRQLSLGDKLVKQFLVPAANQEIILNAFQELGWPECIDNPLADGDETTAKRRLHNAITRLNHQQIHPLIRFHGNGNGTGVRWERWHRKVRSPNRGAQLLGNPRSQAKTDRQQIVSGLSVYACAFSNIKCTRLGQAAERRPANAMSRFRHQRDQDPNAWLSVAELLRYSRQPQHSRANHPGKFNRVRSAADRPKGESHVSIEVAVGHWTGPQPHPLVRLGIVSAGRASRWRPTERSSR